MLTDRVLVTIGRYSRQFARTPIFLCAPICHAEVAKYLSVRKMFPTKLVQKNKTKARAIRICYTFRDNTRIIQMKARNIMFRVIYSGTNLRRSLHRFPQTSSNVPFRHKFLGEKTSFGSCASQYCTASFIFPSDQK